MQPFALARLLSFSESSVPCHVAISDTAGSARGLTDYRVAIPSRTALDARRSHGPNSPHRSIYPFHTHPSTIHLSFSLFPSKPRRKNFSRSCSGCDPPFVHTHPFTFCLFAGYLVLSSSLSLMLMLMLVCSINSCIFFLQGTRHHRATDRTYRRGDCGCHGPRPGHDRLGGGLQEIAGLRWRAGSRLIDYFFPSSIHDLPLPCFPLSLFHFFLSCFHLSSNPFTP